MSIAWFIFITVVFILVQSSIYKKWGLKNIIYTRSFSHHHVFEGEKIEMIDQIANKKILPIPWLRLESKINANLQMKVESEDNDDTEHEMFHRTLFSLMPYQKIIRRHRVICSKRGYYRLNTVSITTGDMVGFGETFKSVPAQAEVTVYPKLMAIKDIPLPSHSWLGDIIVKRWIMEDPFIHAGVREYTYGDSMGDVNWKATARTNNLQVSKKDFTADHHLMIYLNLDETEDIWLPIKDEQLIEKGLSYAATIAQHAISQGVSTGFGCNGFLVEPFGTSEKNKQSVRLEPKSNKQQLNFIWDTMAKLAMGRSMNFNYFLKEDIDRKVNNLDILLITANMTEKMYANIRQLEALGNAVDIVWLKKEEDGTTEQESNAIGEEGDKYAI